MKLRRGTFTIEVDRELQEVVVARWVRAATVLAVDAAVLKTGRAQQAGRALAVEVATAAEP